MFLSEFDLLRDVRQDVRQKAWASPTNRILRDLYFKVQRAHEEIERLNIEIRRVITYMVDETDFLNAREAMLARENPELAHQVSLYRMERGRAFSIHRTRFAKLFKHPRFSGTTTPGRSVHLPLDYQTTQSSGSNEDCDVDEVANANDDDSDSEESEEEDADAIAYKFLSIAVDGNRHDLED